MAVKRLPQRHLLKAKGAFEAVATFALIVALLYFGAGILVPVVLAVLLAFALSPVVRLLTRRLHLPDPVAVLISVIGALLCLVVFAYAAGVQLIHIVGELPAYQTTIASKLKALQQQVEAGGFLSGLSDALTSLSEQLTPPPEGSAPVSTPIPVTVSNDIGNSLGMVGSLLGTLAGPLATAAIVLVFLIFLLLGRSELQERFIRLVSRGGFSTTTLAMSDASQRVGRYLLLQLCINVGYGIAFGTGLLAIGVPGAILWGLLIMFFRYIPFVGGLLVALIPFLLAFAVDGGWTMLALSVALFLVIDLTTANVVEPRVYGSSTGVSAIAILVSAMFWATLWGPIGLVLATPMTVCLVVIGRYIPQLQVLETLLGSDPVLAPPERLYQQMLKGDVEEAIEIADETIEESGLESFHDTVLVPALRLASEELSDTSEALSQRRVMTTSLKALVDETAPEGPVDGNRVLLVGGRTELDEIAGKVVSQRLAAQGIPSRTLPPIAIKQEHIAVIDLEGIELVCLFYLGEGFKVQARYVSRRLKHLKPELKVLVCELSETAGFVPATALRVDFATRDIDASVKAIDEILGVISADSPSNGAPIEGTRVEGHLADALKRIAAELNVPIATVGLLGDARHQRDEDAYSLTRKVTETDEIVVLRPGSGESDADRFLQGNGIGSYVGVPLRDHDGKPLGALVLIDYQAREFSDEELARARQMAVEISSQLEPA
jgi:predicted PurR-regulated permease PerM